MVMGKKYPRVEDHGPRGLGGGDVGRSCRFLLSALVLDHSFEGRQRQVCRCAAPLRTGGLSIPVPLGDVRRACDDVEATGMKTLVVPIGRIRSRPHAGWPLKDRQASLA